MKNLETIKKYIETQDEDLLDEEDVMIVDWRDYDEDIISNCEEILQTGSLEAEMNDVDNKQGFEIVIKYKGKETLIPYQGEGSDRDTTIITLNEVLKPEYEIRLVKDGGGDTLLFLPLEKENWENLENEYGEKIQKLFDKIDKNSVMFG